MQKSYNSKTPKIVGGIVISAFVLLAVYTFFINGDDTDASDNSVATTSSQLAIADNVSTKTDTKASTESDTNTAESSSTQLSSGTSDSTQSNSQTTSSYKDGTYKASTSYRVPHGTNSIEATVSIKDGVIESVDVTDDYSDRESSMYISSFESKVQSVVKGKSISSISVGRIGGASLTSSAFENVLSDIIVEARI